MNPSIARVAVCLILILVGSDPSVVLAQKPRARNLGIPFDGVPGAFNAITDVKGPGRLQHDHRRAGQKRPGQGAGPDRRNGHSAPGTRVPPGVGIVGGRGENGSGDIFLAFSTANPSAFQREKDTNVNVLPNDEINPLFEATVQAVEEAILNAMVAAETMEGINGNKAYALPHRRVVEILRNYGRIR